MIEKYDWIDIKNRLPDVYIVIACNANNDMLVGTIRAHNDSYMCESGFDFIYDVTHWMPRPMPPIREEVQNVKKDWWKDIAAWKDGDNNRPEEN